MKVTSNLQANVWKILVEVGQSVNEGDVLMILESMKMEIPVEAPQAGKVTEICCKADDQVEDEQLLAVID